MFSQAWFRGSRLKFEPCHRTHPKRMISADGSKHTHIRNPRLPQPHPEVACHCGAEVFQSTWDDILTGTALFTCGRKGCKP